MFRVYILASVRSMHNVLPLPILIWNNLFAPMKDNVVLKTVKLDDKSSLIGRSSDTWTELWYVLISESDTDIIGAVITCLCFRVNKTGFYNTDTSWPNIVFLIRIVPIRAVTLWEFSAVIVRHGTGIPLMMTSA